MRELWGVFAVALVACGGADAGRDTPEEGRGSAECRKWQDSVCDWAVRCRALPREVCDAQFQGVTCRSDTSASKCTGEWDSASCFETPARCGIAEIADPAPAARACDVLMEQFCERSTECGISASTAECVSTEGVDCSRSVAYGLGYEGCLDRIDELDCQQVRLPEDCEAVIISSP